MPLYKYRAKDGPENIIDGRIEAMTREEAIEKVSQLGYLPVQIEEELVKTKVPLTRRPLYSGRVKSHDITIFSRQLASFMKSGMPILRALTIISAQSTSPRLKDMFNNICSELKGGKALSWALANYPRVFSPLYIAMVRSGEGSGTLPEVFIRIADYRQKQEELFSQVRMVLVYPALMVAVAVATIIFMFTFIMPRLTHIFSSVGEDLPLATEILIAISNGLRLVWPWMALGIAVVFFVIKQKKKTKAAGIAISRLKLKLPIFGTLALRAELVRFSRTLELLIKNGIPILKALGIAIPVLTNEVIKQELRRCHKDLEQGGSFGRSLQKSTLFPIFMSNLLIVGEESGRLEEALLEIADSYEKETKEATKMMATLLEPLIILTMGLVTGFIVIAMLLPIFQINLMVR